MLSLPSIVLCKNACCGGVSPCIVLIGMLGRDADADSGLCDSSRGFNTVTSLSAWRFDGAGDVDVELLLEEETLKS